MKKSLLLSLILGVISSRQHTAAAEAGDAKQASPTPAKNAEANPEADKLWQDLGKAAEPPQPPEEWSTRRPSEAEVMKFRGAQSGRVAAAADLARDFYTRHPNHPKAGEAREMELDLAGTSLAMGNSNFVARVEGLVKERSAKPGISEDEKFGLNAKLVQQRAMSKMAQGMEVVFAEFESGARGLLKDFPGRAEPFAMLMEVASNTEGEKGVKLAAEIAANPAAPEDVKEGAKQLVKKSALMGSKLDLKFTAVDGREVDVAKLKGKVVLIDFWATWCGPCVAELPNVKAAYEKLHPKGFEIVGISFDQEKRKLEQFVSKQDMAWPQYFDGLGWQNKFGKEYGINSIPAMWLVDKKGIVRSLNARPGLAESVEKLLAEKD